MKFKIKRGLAAAVMAAGILMFGVTASTASAQDAGTISVTGVDLQNDTVEITNSGDSEVDVNGVILCNFPTYQPIAGADPIAPGGSITVDAGSLGVDLADDQGELGLYSSNAFEDPDAIISYVEWGTAGHQRSSVAVSAGIWDGEAVDAGSSLTASVDTPTSAADWTSAAPTLAATGAGTWIIGALAGAVVALGLGASAISRRGNVA